MQRRDAAPARPPNPAMPYREDCWSEGETSTLVNAWGHRYLELNRGNLRQKQWQEVADSVNARPGGGRRPPRTDVQCKNRIDTLKKKYKIEKTKICNGAGTSQWPFYSHLDMLVGSSVPPKKPAPSRSPPLALPIPLPLPSNRSSTAAVRQKRSAPADIPFEDSFIRKNYSAAAAAAAAAASDVDSGSSSRSRSSRSSVDRSNRLRRCSNVSTKREIGQEDGIRDLARSIERFAEIYEKVEGEKQRQMMELEKQKMDFIKGLEFQRMQMFVDTQIQLERIKRSRRIDAESYS